MLDTKKLGQFFAELAYYGDYEITANGEVREWDIEELVSRVDTLADDEEAAVINRLLSDRETVKLMEFLSYQGSFDIGFSQDNT